MPALWRPHDCDRGLRARPRAKVAADPKQGRYVMSQTACERRHFLVPMHWLHAGGDLSRPNHANQRPDRPSIRSTRRPTCPLHASRLLCAHPCRSPGAGIAPTTIVGTKIKSPIAVAAQPAPNFPRLLALALFGRRPPECVCRSSCRRPKTSCGAHWLVESAGQSLLGI